VPKSSILLKIKAAILLGFDMKNPSPFPKFPKGLSTKEVRQEIQRRLELVGCNKAGGHSGQVDFSIHHSNPILQPKRAAS
jgi:hypothetical protein